MTWLIYLCDTTYSYMVYECVVSHIRTYYFCIHIQEMISNDMSCIREMIPFLVYEWSSYTYDVMSCIQEIIYHVYEKWHHFKWSYMNDFHTYVNTLQHPEPLTSEKWYVIYTRNEKWHVMYMRNDIISSVWMIFIHIWRHVMYSRNDVSCIREMILFRVK